MLGVLLLAAGLAACGGSSAGGDNGLRAKSAAAILNATTNASESAKSVHVTGSLEQQGTTIALDLRMVAGVGASGWMSDGGMRFMLVLDHSTLYISGGRAFWRAFGNAAVAKRLKGKWLKTPDTGSYAGIAQIANMRLFFRQVFGGHGPLAKTSNKTIDGTATIGLRDTEKGGVLYVSTSGKPYPVEISGNTGATTGRLTFTGFNAPVAIRAPKRSISLARLERAG